MSANSQKRTSAHATRWLSGHGQLTKIRRSDGCRGKTITTAAVFEYDRHRFEAYLGNVRSIIRTLRSDERC